MRANLSSNMPIIIVSFIIISSGTSSGYYYSESQSAIAQMPSNSTQPLSAQQLTEHMGVKISSPLPGQKVPLGELNISGTSTDNAAKDCSVFVDVNDIKPLQKTEAVGSGGQNDYSNWTFTYTEDYHLITEGPNELTAKLSCNENLESTTGGSSIPINNTSNGISKWYSINVTGVAIPSVDQNKNQSETQSTNAFKQNASVSESSQHKTSDHASIATLANSIQEKKIAGINEEELSQPESSSTQDLQLQHLSSEIEDLDSTSVMQHPVPSSDLTIHDSLGYSEQQQPHELHIQEQPMPMSNMPNENDAGNPLIEEIQGIDIDGADNGVAPDEDEPTAPITEAPLQDTEFGSPLELFRENNQGQADLEQEDTSQTANVDKDLSDEARSANDIYGMITGSFAESIDTVDTDTVDTDTVDTDTEDTDTEDTDTEDTDTEDLKTEQDRDPGDAIAEEIPLIQSYTRDIESTLE